MRVIFFLFFTIFSIFSLKAQPSGSNNKKKAEPEIYEKLITKADNELGLKNLEAAKALYQRALGLKSNDPYPKRKIDEIDKLLNSKNEIKSEPSPHLPIISSVMLSQVFPLNRASFIPQSK